MNRTETIKFEHNSFDKRIRSMLKVDCRRMFTTPLFYIMVGICLAAPILILIMTTTMDGTVSVDPKTGVETVVEGFDNVWQIIGSVSGNSSSMDAGMIAMCNINLLYVGLAVLVGLFVSGDFRSGYAKNLFAVRAKKTDYVISKTLVCLLVGVFMLLAFFVGAMLGGIISGLPFDMEGFTAGNLIMCILAKVFLIAVFVPIYLAVSVAAKQKTWLSIVGSCAVGMMLFMMIPALTPLDSKIMNVIMCLVGGALFSIGVGAISNTVLRKTSLV